MYNVVELNDEYQIYIKKGAILLNSAKEILNEMQNYIGYDCYNISNFPVRENYYISPITLETQFLSKVAFVVKKDIVNSIKSNSYTSDFINKDVELKLLKENKKIKCLYNVNTKFDISHSLESYIEDIKEKNYVNYKYFNSTNEFKSAIKSPKSYPNVRKELIKEYLNFNLNKIKIKKEKYKISLPKEIDMGFFEREDFLKKPNVSIIIRTHKRKLGLKLTLNTLRNQNYTNFEIVIVEDGENTAEEMIKSEFSDMNINYYATKENKGRSVAGNIGLSRARGEYVCFLDDDDFLYPDFILSNIQKFNEDEEKKIVFSSFVSLNIDLFSNQPYKFSVKSIDSNIFSHISLMDMCVKCRVPITGAMFKRELYLKYGGMREDLQADEDWHLWLKFLSKINQKSFLKEADIKRCISACVYPADENLAKERHDKYSFYDDIMLRDEELIFKVSKEEILFWQNTVKSDVMHLKNNGLLEDFLNNLKPLGEKNIDEEKGEYTAFEINNYYYYLIQLYSNEMI